MDNAVTKDVVVVGFGGAGAAAAISAHDAGASVVIVEKMPEALAGGSTVVSGNVWCDLQDVDMAARYLRELSAEWPLDDQVVRAWAQGVVSTTDWVRSLGYDIGFMPMPHEFPELPSHECDPGYRFVMPSWGMGRLYGALKDAVARRDIEVIYECAAQRLQTDSSGAVTGLVAKHQEEALRIMASGGVVLATGGFTNSRNLVRTYIGLPDACPWGSPALTGDGLRMAQEAGAALTNTTNYMGVLGISVPQFESGFNIPLGAHDAWIMVDRKARRFADERARVSHGKMRDGDGYQMFPGRPSFAIFDDQIGSAGPLVPSVEDQGHGWLQRMGGHLWSSDNSTELEKGWLHRADTPEELGERLGIDGAQLARTISMYNLACERRQDQCFGRNPDTLLPLQKAPFYGFKWGYLLAFTNGGPAKDSRARVLDAFGDPIPGLYAAGEVASTYPHCYSGGFMIADALCFGRIAGHSAARDGKPRPTA